MKQGKLNSTAKGILTTLLKNDRHMTTSEIAKEVGISWNTALSYLNTLHKRGWVSKEGDRTLYWTAILEE